MQLNRWQLLAVTGVVGGSMVGSYLLGRQVQRNSVPRTEYRVLNVAVLNADLIQKLGKVKTRWRVLEQPMTEDERAEDEMARQMVDAAETEMRTRTSNAMNKLLAEGWSPDGDVESGLVVFHRRID